MTQVLFVMIRNWLTYFQESLTGNISPKALANWLLGPVKSTIK